jgi:hypothetical protein
MASILSWTRLFSSGTLKATTFEDGEKLSHKKVLILKEYKVQGNVDCLQLKLSVALRRRSRACYSTSVVSLLFFFTSAAIAWSPTMCFSNSNIRLRSRRTSSDSLPIAEFKELSARETVKVICNKLFDIHTQKISKGIIRFKHPLPSGDIKSISFRRVMIKEDDGNKASLIRYKTTDEISMFILQLKES